MAKMKGAARKAGEADIQAEDADEAALKDPLWSNEQIHALNEIAQVANRSLDIQETLDFVADKLAEILPADFLIVRLLEEDGTLGLKVARGLPAGYESRHPKREMGKGISGLVAQRCEPALIPDVRRKHRLSYDIRFYSRCAMSVPLMSEGRLVGVLSVASKKPNMFSGSDLLLLSSVGHHLGTAIDKTFRAERLAFSDQRYRYLFENAAEPFFVTDARGFITEANRAACSFSGYSREELSTKKLDELVVSPDQSAVSNTIQSDDSRNLSFRRKGGQEATVRCLSRPVFRDSQLVGTQSIIQELTKQQWTQQAMGDYLRQVTLAQEEERKRIARDLHDDSIQSIVIASHRLRRFSAQHHMALGDEATGDLQGTINLLLECAENLRRLTISLRPSILDDVGLVPSLRWVGQRLKEASNIECDVEISGQQFALSSETELALFRIVQEALNNVRRHSGATKASINLTFGKGQGTLIIRDNGHGFAKPAFLSALGALGKLGLVGMRQRADQIGASFEIESTPDKGTAIIVSF